MMRVRRSLSYGLGQMPSGRVEISSSRALASREECESFDGKHFDEDRLCCTGSESAGWYCRRTSYGAPGTPGGPLTPPGMTPPGMSQSTGLTIAAGIAAVMVIGATLFTRRRTTSAAPAVVAPAAAPA